MATRVAIYARVSTDDKGQDPENQLRQLRQWCERMGYPVVREYVEHENGGKGIDAYSDDVGRAFRLMSATYSDRCRPAVSIDAGRGGGAPAGRM
jgi:Resolvase, N terminal domain